MTVFEFLLVILLSRVSHQSTVLNRMLDFWQPHDVYIIYNSTNPGEDALVTMSSPRHVSTHGNFSSFLPPKELLIMFPNNFVLVLITDDNCQHVVSTLKSQLLQRTIVKRSKVVVVIRNAPQHRLDAYFRDIWNLGMLNVFFLDNSFIFSFNPFTNDFLIQHPAEEYHKVISVDRAGNWHGAVIRVSHLQLVQRTSKRQYVSKYSLVRWPFEKFFNATPHVFIPDINNIGFELFNGASSTVLPGIGSELATGNADLTFISRSMETSNYFDYVYPHEFTECSLLVPKSKRIPQYTRVARVVFGWVGISTIVSLTVAFVFLMVVKRTLHIQLELTGILFGLASVFFGQSFKIPLGTISMRLVIITWLLTCISISTLFKAQIVSSFLKPRFFTDYDDPFEAMRDTGHKVYTLHEYYYNLKLNEKSLFESKEKYQLISTHLEAVSVKEYFHRVYNPNGKDMFMTLTLGRSLILQTLHMTDQMYTYHLTKPMFIKMLSNVVPRGSIIYHRFNDFYFRIFESGLYDYWDAMELFSDRYTNIYNFAEKHQQSLTVRDLYSAFIVLILGHALAATVLLVERFVARFQKKF